MNDIVDKENRQENLDLLLAMRRLYSSAKNYFTWRTSIATSLAFLGPILASQGDVYAAYIGLFALLYLLADRLYLQPKEEKKQGLAARTQELFDTKVLDLPWNSTVAGNKPAAESISDALRGHKREEYDSLSNWYSADVSSVEIGFGRILCQRSNLAWDSSLRKRYVAVLALALVFLVGVFVAIAYYFDFTFSQVVGGIIFPCLPLLDLLITQIRGHLKAASNTETLVKEVDGVIEEICAGQTVPHINRSRTFQNEIFNHRKCCPLVFDWLYWLLRTRQEQNMRFSVEATIREFTTN
jgi:hypothetical protein